MGPISAHCGPKISCPSWNTAAPCPPTPPKYSVSKYINGPSRDARPSSSRSGLDKYCILQNPGLVIGRRCLKWLEINFAQRQDREATAPKRNGTMREVFAREALNNQISDVDRWLRRCATPPWITTPLDNTIQARPIRQCTTSCRLDLVCSFWLFDGFGSTTAPLTTSRRARPLWPARRAPGHAGEASCRWWCLLP
jgi:hypothetical protein